MSSNMGGPDWSHVLYLSYAPFVTVTNNTGWPLTLDGGGTNQYPKVVFQHPKLGLRFKRVGDSHAGFITTPTVPLESMYISAPNKVFSMNLMASASSPPAYVTLQPGETKVLTPEISAGADFYTVFDWNGSLTTNLQSTPGWKGTGNGYAVDYLAGQNQYQVGNTTFPVIPNRLSDSWDVEVKTVGSLNGCRVFRAPASPSATWPMAPAPESQVTQFPMNLTGFQSSAMVVQPTQALTTWQTPVLFSVLFPPGSQTAFITDRTRNGMNDEWEKHFFHGNTAVPTEDADGDGFSNLAEFLAGTSPVDSADFIRQSLVEQPGEGPRFEWSSLANRSYVVETSTDLKNWTGSETITATGPTSSFPVSRPETGPFFMRARIIPPIQPYR